MLPSSSRSLLSAVDPSRKGNGSHPALAQAAPLPGLGRWAGLALMSSNTFHKEEKANWGVRRQKRRKPGVAISSFERILFISLLSWLRKQLGGNCPEDQLGSYHGSGNPESRFSSVRRAERPRPGRSKLSKSALTPQTKLFYFAPHPWIVSKHVSSYPSKVLNILICYICTTVVGLFSFLAMHF